MRQGRRAKRVFAGVHAAATLRLYQSELQAPCPDRLVADVDAPLEQQLLHVPVRDRQTVVKVDGMTDDQLGKAITFRTFDRVV